MTSQAMKLVNSIARRVSDCTERNDHTTALIIIAKEFDYQGSLATLHGIKTRQLNLGYVCNHDNEERSKVEKHMLNLIAELDEEAAIKIMTCL